MRRLMLLGLIVGLLSTLVGTPVARADESEPGPLVVVFDTSGSMSEAGPDGTVKLTAARKSMSDMIYSMSDSPQSLGLWTYPSGDYRDGCQAGEWVKGLSPKDKPDATDVQAELGLLRARGETPTGPALRAVVEALERQEVETATIVLVSDGAANCGPPACEVAREIIASGFALTVAAVAFDIADESGRSDLECAAKATGGSYSTAEDTTQLIDELAKYQHRDLELDVDIPQTVLAGEVMQVTATVRNPSRNVVRNVSLLLAFDDVDITQHVPSPQRRLPALGPGASISRSWVVSTRSSLKGERTWRILAGSTEASALKKGTVTFTQEHLQRADGGDLLADSGGTVLILGDSYSSGEGTADYVKDDYTSPDGKIRCHRSQSSYGGVIGGEDARVIACSGAVSSDLENVNVGVADQLSILALQLNPDLVLLTIGGNDIGFAGIVEQCFIGDCAADQSMHLARIAEKAGWAETYKKIAELVNRPKQLQHRDGRPVPVVVSPYPDPLWEVTSGRCNAGAEIEDWCRNGISLGIISFVKGDKATNVGFSQRDIAAGKTILTALNSKIEASVAAAQASGFPVYYASTVSSFAAGHSMCVDDSYFVRLDPKSAVWRKIEGDAAYKELFHPNKKGHTAWADSLIVWSQSAKADTTLKAQPLGPVQKPYVPMLWRPKVDVAPKLQPVLPPNLWYPPSGPALSAAPGSRVDVKVDGLAPMSSVLLTVRSEPIALGQLLVNENGVASGTVTLPELSSGSHELIVEGYNGSFELVGAVVNLRVWSGLPWLLVGAMVLCLVSSVMAVVFYLKSRTRRREAHGERTP